MSRIAPVFFRLFVLFTLLPLVELVLLVWLTWQTNWLVTLLTILVPGILGAWLVRWEGMRCLRLARRQIVRGQVPAAEILDALLIIVAGVLLITPGMLTDVAGLALVFPPVRRFVRGRLSEEIRARMIRFVSASVPPDADDGERRDGPVVDAESRPRQP
jgi:UPF0716 protein FxsA